MRFFKKSNTTGGTGEAGTAYHSAELSYSYCEVLPRFAYLIKINIPKSIYFTV